MEKLALALQLPMIKLVDGSSGGGSVTTILKEGWSYVPPLTGFAEVVEQLKSEYWRQNTRPVYVTRVRDLPVCR